VEITDVRLRKVDDQNRLKAIASITIDNAFAIHELRVIEGSKGLFVAMPSRKTKTNVFRDIAHPINAEAREKVEQAVLAKYAEEGSNDEEEE
jgi:stage V sporulation protein G